jgi:hypothetical protein
MNRPSGQERGLEMKLLGTARFDRTQGRFVAFELVAVGTRWGARSITAGATTSPRRPSGRCSALPERAAPSASRPSISAATVGGDKGRARSLGSGSRTRRTRPGLGDPESRFSGSSAQPPAMSRPASGSSSTRPPIARSAALSGDSTSSLRPPDTGGSTRSATSDSQASRPPSRARSRSARCSRMPGPGSRTPSPTRSMARTPVSAAKLCAGERAAPRVRGGRHRNLRPRSGAGRLVTNPYPRGSMPRQSRRPPCRSAQVSTRD